MWDWVSPHLTQLGMTSEDWSSGFKRKSKKKKKKKKGAYGSWGESNLSLKLSWVYVVETNAVGSSTGEDRSDKYSVWWELKI